MSGVEVSSSSGDNKKRLEVIVIPNGQYVKI